MKNKKGQIWSIDAVFALVIFGFTITILAVAWLSISNEVALAQSSGSAQLSFQSKSFSDIIMSAGYPTNWYGEINDTDPAGWTGVVPGIGTGNGEGAISPYKLYALMSISNYDYRASQALFGTGYNYYISISGGQNTGWENITAGRDPFTNGATTVYVSQRSGSLNGEPVNIQIMLWMNASVGVS